MISVDFTALIICALVFALVFVLKNFFFEPLAQAMETRQASVDRAASAWDDAQKTIDKARTDVAAAVQMARNEGYQWLDEARSGAQAKVKTSLDEQRGATQKRIAEARQQLSNETDEAVLFLERDAYLLASQLASKILGRGLE